MKAERTEHGASMIEYSVCRCCVVYFQRYGYMVTISRSAISRGDGREIVKPWKRWNAWTTGSRVAGLVS